MLDLRAIAAIRDLHVIAGDQHVGLTNKIMENDKSTGIENISIKITNSSLDLNDYEVISERVANMCISLDVPERMRSLSAPMS